MRRFIHGSLIRYGKPKAGRLVAFQKSAGGDLGLYVVDNGLTHQELCVLGGYFVEVAVGSDQTTVPSVSRVTAGDENVSTGRGRWT